MIYQKTHEGRAALRERNALNLRERQLMVLVNGSRSMDELADLFGSGVTADVEKLANRGFVVVHGETNPSIPDILLSDLERPPENPPTRFLASQLDSATSSLAEPTALPRMSLEDLMRLADVPAPDLSAVGPVRSDLRGDFAADLATGGHQANHQPPQHQPIDPLRSARPPGVAAAVNSIAAEQVPVRTPVAGQAYMTQVLMALGSDAATRLIETSGDVRHDADILVYLAQGLGHTYAVAGEDVTLRVALRVSRLLPDREVPMLLDCALDYVPSGFSVLLYEFVLAGRDTGG